MAIYTVGRRRVIIALLLSSALILTLDLRGNAVLDRARDAFGVAMTPVETAADVVTNPVKRAWDSYSNYDDLERENEILQQRVDELIGTQAAAEASVVDSQQLLALNDLPSLAGIDTEKAEVVGASVNNIDQIIEINKGSLDNVAIGMPVVHRAGLIGRVTRVRLNTSQVMLVTDPRFALPVEILGGTGSVDLTGTNGDTATTTPSGLDDEEIDEIVDPAVPTTTTALDVLDDGFSLPQAGDDDTLDPALVPSVTTTTVPGDLGLPPAIPVDGSPIPTTIPATTTTTTLPDLQKEFGAMEGQGQGRLPQIRFLQDNPSLAILQEGDLVETAGGADSLAPPNIPIGRVVNRADRPGVAGPILEVELNADLDRLNFVQVVLFRPASEVEQ
jgi:rod shape-determining protein MreC